MRTLQKFNSFFAFSTLIFFTFTSIVAPVVAYANQGDCEKKTFSANSRRSADPTTQEDELSKALSKRALQKKRLHHLHQNYLPYRIRNFFYTLGDSVFIRSLLFEKLLRPIFIDGLYHPSKTLLRNFGRTWKNKDSRKYYLFDKPILQSGSKAMLATWLGKSIGRWAQSGGIGGIFDALSFSTLGTAGFWHSLLFEVVAPIGTDIIPKTETSRFRKLSFPRKMAMSWLFPGAIFAGITGAIPLGYGLATHAESYITYGLASIAFSFPMGIAYHAFGKWMDPYLRNKTLDLREKRNLKNYLTTRDMIFDMELHSFQTYLFGLTNGGMSLIFLEYNKESQIKHEAEMEDLMRKITLESAKEETARDQKRIKTWEKQITALSKKIDSLKKKEEATHKTANESAKKLEKLIDRLSQHYNDIYKLSRAHHHLKNKTSKEAIRLESQINSIKEDAQLVFSALVETRTHKNGVIDQLFDRLLGLRGELSMQASSIALAQENGSISNKDVKNLKFEYDATIQSIIELLQEAVEKSNKIQTETINVFKRNLRAHSGSEEVLKFQYDFDYMRTKARHLDFSLNEMNKILQLTPDGIASGKADILVHGFKNYIQTALIGILLASAYFTARISLIGNMDEDDEEKLLRSIALKFYLGWKNSEGSALGVIDENTLDQAIAHAKILIKKVIEDIPENSEDLVLTQLAGKIGNHDYRQDDMIKNLNEKLTSDILRLEPSVLEANPDADFSGFFGAQASQIIHASAKEVVKVFQNRNQINALEKQIPSFKDVEYVSGGSPFNFNVEFTFSTQIKDLVLRVENHFRIFEHVAEGKTHQIISWTQDKSSLFKYGNNDPQNAIHQNAGIIIITPLGESKCRATIYGFQWVNEDLLLMMQEKLGWFFVITGSSPHAFLENITEKNYSGFIKALNRQFK